MPAEWAPHSMTLMCWPANRNLWGVDYDAALDAYAALLRTIRRFEPVRLIVPPRDCSFARGRVGDDDATLEVAQLEIDDAWARDSGPIYVRDGDGSESMVRRRFNGWGEKYRHHNDDLLPRALASLDRLPLIESPLVLEGRAIAVDGEGTLITTESVVLNRNRNPRIDKPQAEAEFRRLFGTETVIWWPGGIVGDETDGHVDNVAAFIAPGVVAALTCRDKADDNHAVLNENVAILPQSSDARKRRLTIVERSRRLLPLSVIG